MAWREKNRNTFAFFYILSVLIQKGQYICDGLQVTTNTLTLIPMIHGSLCPLPLKVDNLCDCFDQQNIQEVTLWQFPGPRLNRLAASTSCLLGKSVALQEACLHHDHHAVRKPKLAMWEAMYRERCLTHPQLIHSSQHRHQPCESRSLQRASFGYDHTQDIKQQPPSWAHETRNHDR